MVCFDLPVKRCEQDRAWLSQPLLLSSMQNLKVWKSGRLIVTPNFHTSQYGRELVRVCQHSILETCAYQLRIYKSAFYSCNFHIFRLFGFGKEEVDVYRFMSKKFIALFVYLSFALSSLFLPQKCVVLF